MRKKYRELPDQSRLHELFTYDPETGCFSRRVNRGKWKAGEAVGTKTPDGYISINVDYTIFRAHRLAWVYMTGAAPANGIDHANGVRDDNRWANLREADQSQNGGNKRVQKNSASGAKGVFPYGKRGRFRAVITKHGTNINLGCFDTAEEAKAAYNAAAKVIHGEFWRP